MYTAAAAVMLLQGGTVARLTVPELGSNGCMGSAASLKRSFDIWLLEGLFPCCCFFPLGGMKQAHHKNCGRARADLRALVFEANTTGADGRTTADLRRPACALTDSSFANWSGLRESHAQQQRPPHMQPTNTT